MKYLILLITLSFLTPYSVNAIGQDIAPVYQEFSVTIYDTEVGGCKVIVTVNWRIWNEQEKRSLCENYREHNPTNLSCSGDLSSFSADRLHYALSYDEHHVRYLEYDEGPIEIPLKDLRFKDDIEDNTTFVLTGSINSEVVFSYELPPPRLLDFSCGTSITTTPTPITSNPLFIIAGATTTGLLLTSGIVVYSSFRGNNLDRNYPATSIDSNQEPEFIKSLRLGESIEIDQFNMRLEWDESLNEYVLHYSHELATDPIEILGGQSAQEVINSEGLLRLPAAGVEQELSIYGGLTTQTVPNLLDRLLSQYSDRPLIQTMWKAYNPNKTAKIVNNAEEYLREVEKEIPGEKVIIRSEGSRTSSIPSSYSRRTNISSNINERPLSRGEIELSRRQVQRLSIENETSCQ